MGPVQERGFDAKNLYKSSQCLASTCEVKVCLFSEGFQRSETEQLCSTSFLWDNYKYRFQVQESTMPLHSSGGGGKHEESTHRDSLCVCPTQTHKLSFTGFDMRGIYRQTSKAGKSDSHAP